MRRSSNEGGTPRANIDTHKSISVPRCVQPYLSLCVGAYTSTLDSGISEVMVDFFPHLVNCRLSTEIRHRVPSCKKLPQLSIERKQPMGRQHSTKLFGSHHELVAGIKALGEKGSKSGQRVSCLILFDC